MIVVSLCSEAPSDEKLRGLTFATTTPEQRAESRASWTQGDLFASGFVLLLILLAYLYFRG